MRNVILPEDGDEDVPSRRALSKKDMHSPEGDMELRDQRELEERCLQAPLFKTDSPALWQ